MPLPRPSVAADGDVPRARAIPSLDGLRAISIALVMAAHASACPGFPAALGAAVQTLATGMLGVRVFFVISGFLITTLLMREREATGRVALGRFYARRSVRILPAYLAFLAGMALAQRAGWLPPLTEPVVTRAAAHALTFTANYAAVLPWAVRHLWSLSVEEQFYLLWPLVIAVAGVARGARWAAMFAGVTPLVRFTLYAAAPMYLRRVGYTFETAADAIAIGCLLAVWRDTLWTRAWYRALLASRWFALVPALALGLGALMPLQLLSFTVGISAQALLVALVIDRTVRFSDGLTGRLLNARPMRALGVLSYSLYLWQQPFLSPAGYVWNRLPLALLGALGAAVASYFLVERPMLRLRDRWDARRRLASLPSSPVVARAA